MFVDENAPAAERAAQATLQCQSIEAINARFDEISALGQARMDEQLSRPGVLPPSGFTAFDYLTESEKEERHVLMLAIQMDEQQNERRRAHERIMQRRAERYLRGRLRRAVA